MCIFCEMRLCFLQSCCDLTLRATVSTVFYVSIFTFPQTTDIFTSVRHIWTWGHILPEFVSTKTGILSLMLFCVSAKTLWVSLQWQTSTPSGNCSVSTYKTTVWSHLLPGLHHSDSSDMIIYLCATPVVCAAFKEDGEHRCTKALLFLLSPHHSSSPLPKENFSEFQDELLFSILGSFWKLLHFKCNKATKGIFTLMKQMFGLSGTFK